MFKGSSTVHKKNRIQDRLSYSFSFVTSLLLLALATFSIVAGQAIGYENTWAFAALITPAVYVSTLTLVKVIYAERFAPATTISSALIVWYFGPLILFSIGIPGLTISLSPTELATASIRMIGALCLAIPLLLIEARAARSWMQGLVSLSPACLTLFLLAVSLFQLGLIVSGGWTYGSLLLASSQGSSGESGKALLQLVNLSAVSSMPIAGFLLGSRRVMRQPLSLVVTCIICLIVGLTWHFIGGRRFLAVELALTAILFLRGQYGHTARKPPTKVLVRTFATLLALIIIAWPTYFAVRVASQSVRAGQEMPSAAELLGAASDVQSTDLEQGYSSQVVDRSAIITPMGTLIPTLRTYSGGEGLLYSLKMAAPSQLIDKSSLPPSIEDIWASFGAPLNDYSNSLLLDSYVDFGPSGYVVYTAVVSFFAYAVIFVFSRSALSAGVIYTVLVFQFLNAENTLTSYIAVFRNCFIIAAIALPASLFKRRGGDALSSSASHMSR